MPLTRFLSVYKHFWIAHCSVELYKHLLIGSEFGHIELSAIPAHAYKGQSAGTTCMLDSSFLSVLLNSGALNVVFHIKRAIDSPVVRDSYALPFSIVIKRFGCLRIILSAEFPPFVKGLLLRPACSSNAQQ